jgi:excinuclease UvrABC nuclease subunit
MSALNIISEVTYLYRHFDENNNLLYVGISLNAINRLSQHKNNAKWYPKISYIKIEKYENRIDAMEAERLAIIKEKPSYNIVFNREKIKKQKRLKKKNTPHGNKGYATMTRTKYEGVMWRHNKRNTKVYYARFKVNGKAYLKKIGDSTEITAAEARDIRYNMIDTIKGIL